MVSVAGSPGWTFEQGVDDPSLLHAALRAGIAFPYECSSGGCGSCRFKPVTGAVKTLWEDAPGLTARDSRNGYRLACQTRALSDLTIDVREDTGCKPVVPPRRVNAAVEDRRDLTRDIAEFRLRSKEPASFRPGQYVLLEHGGLRRCYSMSNTANDEGVWEFMIKRVPGGAFSSWLFDDAPGPSVTLDGPYGMAYLREDSERDVLCVAGGSGLSPMVSIARGIAEEAAFEGRALRFFYGGRTSADVCGEQELLALGLGSRLRFTAVVSDVDAAATNGWSGPTGLVHESVADDIGVAAREMEVYFAGPPPMAEAMQRLLMLDLQVPFEQVHFDRFF